MFTTPECDEQEDNTTNKRFSKFYPWEWLRIRGKESMRTLIDGARYNKAAYTYVFETNDDGKDYKFWDKSMERLSI